MLKVKICLLSMALMLLTTGAGVEAGEFISPDEIVPGMKGYGLTVFRGTDPETFSVEAVGVMRNRFPKQDLVIILMEDPKLIESNVTAGMSGSPIYFNDRLLGALAYGPVFSKKPIAYVTPIQNMLQEMDRPQEPPRPWQRVSRFPDAVDGVTPDRVSRAGTARTMVPVSSTLAVSGFSSDRFHLLEKWFSPYGLIPVASGGSDPALGDGPSAFMPGSAVGVQLMSGDMALTAIGTVTYVDPGGRVLAFGHPFFNIGQTAMPAMTARVHMFMPSSYISYKLSSPIRTLGSMVQDRQPAILIDPKRSAPTVPIAVSVENVQTGHREMYRYRVIREEGLTPFLTFIGLIESLGVSEAGPMGNRTYDIRSRVHLSGRAVPVELSDVTPSPYKSLFDLMMLFDNGVEEAIPSEFEFDVKVTNASRLAWIRSVKSSKRLFRPGEQVPLTVQIRNQKGDEMKLSAKFTLPKTLQGRTADLEIRGGFGFSQPVAPPKTLEQIVSLMEKRPKGNELLVRLMQAPLSSAQDGVVLSNLPVFYQKIVQSGVQGVSPMIAQLPYETTPTEWIVLGSQRVQIEIIPEGKAQ